jgi:tRNA(Leu) C34 or U34 (ribose-2'-O)-methylase TrmL
MLSVALFEPEIPPNTGNIARLCAAVRAPLHVVGVTGFRLDDRAARRAGLEELLRANPDSCLRIPILNPRVRSLNLATAAAVVLYEALRQTGRLKSSDE